MFVRRFGTHAVLRPASTVSARAVRTSTVRASVDTFKPATKPPVVLTPSTPAPSSPLPPAGLKRGSSGDDVKLLQDAAVKLGYLTAAQVATGPGIYGPKTQSAVKALQVRNGLPATGAFDEATRTALGRELSQYDAPEQMVRESYQKLLNREPTAAELSHATEAAVAARDSGASLKDMRAGLLAELRQTPEYQALHPTGNGAVSSTADADAYFLTQWGPTPFNSGGVPYGYSDCGPTSTAMALSSLGLLEHPSAEDAATTIDAVRDAALGYDSTQSTRMGFGPLQRAVAQYGGQATMLPAPMIDSIDAAIERGNPVVIGGDPWAAWGKDQRAAGNYLNSKDPGGHFVSVLGKTADGQYIVADPLVKNGSITVSADQLRTFFGQGFGAMEVSRP